MSTVPTMSDALRIIIAGSPEAARHALDTIQAIQAGSPIVQERYNRVVQMALSDPQAEFTREERALFAEHVALPGGTGSGTRGYTLQVRLSPSEREDLQRQAEAEGSTLSALVRRRVLG